MAVGYRSLLGFPLGAGVTNVPPPATVGFISLFWWMGGLGEAVAPAPVPAGGDDGDWWRSPRRRRSSKKAVGTRPALGPETGESVHAPARRQYADAQKVPHLDRIKSEIAFEVDEILREQGRIDRERRRAIRAKADKIERARAAKALKLEFQEREATRQRLAEERLAARLLQLDDDDAIVLAMSI